MKKSKKDSDLKKMLYLIYSRSSCLFYGDYTCHDCNYGISFCIKDLSLRIDKMAVSNTRGDGRKGTVDRVNSDLLDIRQILMQRI